MDIWLTIEANGDTRVAVGVISSYEFCSHSTFYMLLYIFHRSARIFTWLELDSVLKSHPESWTHYRLDMHASKTTI